MKRSHVVRPTDANPHHCRTNLDPLCNFGHMTIAQHGQIHSVSLTINALQKVYITIQSIRTSGAIR